jgi:hypothetical protein
VFISAFTFRREHNIPAACAAAYDKLGGEVVDLVGDVHDFDRDHELQRDINALLDQAGRRVSIPAVGGTGF